MSGHAQRGGASDPLGILQTTRPVVEASRWVRIAREAVPAVAERLKRARVHRPPWNDLHFSDGTARTANVVLVQDALNFCFWGEPRWQVTYRGKRYDGYWALVAALRRAIETGTPLWDARYLAHIGRGEVAEILRGEDGTTIPLLGARVRHLREVGQVLQARWDGEFASAIRAAAGSAVALVRSVVSHFSAFNDIAAFRGREVRFYKRAQILAGDLAGCFDHRDWGRFDDLDALTAFADYKVPQVLRRLGLLRYHPELADRLERKVELPAGSDEELEIRANTIWAVEELRKGLEDPGIKLSAYELDWYLWEAGQQLHGDDRPYHRTRTVYY